MTAARIVAVASGKGGTGKTTLALALADVWARMGRRVALVDIDPQAGATRALGQLPPEDPLTATPWHTDTPAPFAVLSGGRTLATASDRELRHRLEEAALGAELVVVDLGPSITDAPHATLFSLPALVVVAARCDAMGLANVAETVEVARASGRVVRVVPTFRTGTGLARESEAFLRGRYAGAVTATAFPSDAKAAEAAAKGRPVTTTAARGRAADAVRALALELDQTPAAQ